MYRNIRNKVNSSRPSFRTCARTWWVNVSTHARRSVHSYANTYVAGSWARPSPRSVALAPPHVHLFLEASKKHHLWNSKKILNYIRQLNPENITGIVAAVFPRKVQCPLKPNLWTNLASTEVSSTSFRRLLPWPRGISALLYVLSVLNAWTNHEPTATWFKYVQIDKNKLLARNSTWFFLKFASY